MSPVFNEYFIFSVNSVLLCYVSVLTFGVTSAFYFPRDAIISVSRFLYVLTSILTILQALRVKYVCSNSQCEVFSVSCFPYVLTSILASMHALHQRLVF